MDHGQRSVMIYLSMGFIGQANVSDFPNWKLKIENINNWKCFLFFHRISVCHMCSVFIIILSHIIDCGFGYRMYYVTLYWTLNIAYCTWIQHNTHVNRFQSIEFSIQLSATLSITPIRIDLLMFCTSSLS